MTKSLLNYPLFYPVGTWQLAGSFLYECGNYSGTLLLAAKEILKLKSTRAKRRDLACQIYGVSRMYRCGYCICTYFRSYYVNNHTI